MKLFLPTGAIIICLAASQLRAQDTALPKPEPQVPVEPGLLVTPSPAPTIPAPLLTPDDLLPRVKDATEGLPTIPQLDEGFKPPPSNTASDLQRKQVEWRRLRNGIQNEREVKAALKIAEQAGTDLEKRALLRRYYELLFRRAVARAGPEMKDFLADRKKESLKALSQRRVRPDPSDASLWENSSPSPSPSATPASASPVASPANPEFPSSSGGVQP